MSQQDIEEFYDGFSPTFLRDLAGGNPRVDAVHEFYRQAIHNEARSILVVGCGAGKDAHVLADVIAPRAKVVAVDISENNIRMAE
ncbi:MAG: methyltransferase domain-containing protein, partial [Planctomycetota bacterium]|nr:methyltransferase domain-containing protein [Planctomycetota bacterium]